MNKNSLKQMIVAEMILADIGEGRSESPKKRSLFEMMEDSYLAELEDGRLAHSMESVGNLFEEVPTGDWEVKDRKTGKMRIPGTLLPRTQAQKDSAARDAAARAASKADGSAFKSNKQSSADAADTPADTPAATPAADAQANDEIDTADNDEPRPTDGTKPATAVNIKTTARDSDGPGDKESDSDVNNPSGGLAYLDSLAQAEIVASQSTTDSKTKTESRLSLISLLYDA